MTTESSNVDLLMTVPLRVSAELGACTLTMREVLALGTGSVVALDRPAGAPIDLLVNDKLVARGEIVATGERFGVRITELLDVR